MAGYIDRRITAPPMTDGRRDQRPFNIVQQYLPGLILSTILNTVKEMGDPYQARPGLGGMTAYPSKTIAVACIMMEAEMKTYRKMVGYLGMHPDLVSRIGLSGIPSKSTIRRAYGLIPESYLREVHLRITGDIVAGSLAGDSTGYSGNRFVRWFSIRHSQAKTKRGWIKLHSIIDIATRAIPGYHVTDGYTSDIEVVARSHIKSGRLTHESLTAMAA